MLKRLGFGCLAGVVGYPIGVGAGMLLVHLISPNTHDKSLESAMTGFFVTGPLVAVIGSVVGAVLAGPRKDPDQEHSD